MAEITKEQFKVVGKNTKTMESISRPNIGYWQDAWRRIRKNKIAFFSLCLIGLYVLMAIFVPMFSKYDIATQSVAEMNRVFQKHIGLEQTLLDVISGFVHGLVREYL